MNVRSTLTAVVIGAALALAPATASAQPAPSGQPSAADLESARELFREARELRQKGDLRTALERFKAAHAYGQTAVTALELGRTHMQLGELVEAREMLLSVARMKVQPDETEKSAAARTEASELAEQLRPRIPTIIVKLTNVPPDASVQITVDGAAVPIMESEGIRKTNPGAHVVAAKLGTFEKTETVELAESETREVAFDLGGAPDTKTPAGPDAPVATGRDVSPLTWIGLGVGAAGLAVGSVAGLIALDKASTVDESCEGLRCPESARDAVDSGRTAATVSTIGFAVAGAGLVVGAVGYFLLSKPSVSAASRRVTIDARRRVLPYVGLAWAGLRGAF